MVTPLLDFATLDRDGLERLIEHILRGGVHGIFILGTTGEGPSLSQSLRRDLVKLVCAQVNGRVPVMVGITDTALLDSIALASHAADCGATAVVAAPPPYFAASQTELLSYFRKLAVASPRPVLLYNMPTHTKVNLDVATVCALAQQDNICGLKDSSGDMGYFHQVRRALLAYPAFTLLVGPEELLAESVLLGGHGGVNGGANLFPELYVALFNAASCGDLAEVRRLHDLVLMVSDQLYTLGPTAGSMLQGLKAALAVCGICRDDLAYPLCASDGEVRLQVGERLPGILLALGGLLRPTAPRASSSAY